MSLSMHIVDLHQISRAVARDCIGDGRIEEVNRVYAALENQDRGIFGEDIETFLTDLLPYCLQPTTELV